MTTMTAHERDLLLHHAERALDEQTQRWIAEYAKRVDERIMHSFREAAVLPTTH